MIDPFVSYGDDLTIGFALLRGLDLVWMNQIAEKQGYLTDSKVRTLLAEAKELGLPKIEIRVKSNKETRIFEIHHHQDSSAYGVTYRDENTAKNIGETSEKMTAMRNVVHDFRNPLAVIYSTVELLLETAAGEDRTDLETILKKVDEINGLLVLLPALVEN